MEEDSEEEVFTVEHSLFLLGVILEKIGSEIVITRKELTEFESGAKRLEMTPLIDGGLKINLGETNGTE